MILESMKTNGKMNVCLISESHQEVKAEVELADLKKNALSKKRAEEIKRV